MAHFARQQFVGFLSLLALGDIKKDAEHNSVGYVGIIPLASSGNPADIASKQDAEINLVRAYYCARGGECRSDSLKISGMNVLGQNLESDLPLILRNSPELICPFIQGDRVSVDIPRP